MVIYIKYIIFIIRRISLFLYTLNDLLISCCFFHILHVSFSLRALYHQLNIKHYSNNTNIVLLLWRQTVKQEVIVWIVLPWDKHALWNVCVNPIWGEKNNQISKNDLVEILTWFEQAVVVNLTLYFAGPLRSHIPSVKPIRTAREICIPHTDRQTFVELVGR